MEKVTKDLRRGPGQGAVSMPSPRPSADEPARPPMPTAPPMAPVRAIAREAQVAAAGNGEPLGTVDYGHEIQLPGEIPLAPEPAARPAAQPVVAAARTVDAPMSAPIAAQVAAPVAAPMRTTSAAPTAPSIAHAPARAPSPAARPLSTPSTEPAAEIDAANTIVVPITFPVKGQSSEIIIRIVLKPGE